MSFMQNQIVRDRAYQIETTHGTEIIPFHVAGAGLVGSDLQQYCEGKILMSDSPKIWSVNLLPLGYVYRLSAPGYLDCTSWGYASSEAMAIIHLRELYGDELENEAN